MIELAIERALSTLSRAEVEAVAQVAIDLLDRADVDPDLEDGDRDYCTAGEDRGGRPWSPADAVSIGWDDDAEHSRQPPEWPEPRE